MFNSIGGFAPSALASSVKPFSRRGPQRQEQEDNSRQQLQAQYNGFKRFFDRLGVGNSDQVQPSVLEKIAAEPRRGRHASELAPAGKSGAAAGSAGAADQAVNQYIYFLAAIGSDGGSSPGEFAKRVEEITRRCADPLHPPADDSAGNSSEEWTVESFSFGMTRSSEVALEISSGPDGISFSASAESHMSATFEGEFVTADGHRISISASVQIDVSVQFQAQLQKADPLALDLNGDGELTMGDLEQGGLVPAGMFDINADGFLDQVALVGGADGMLALDRNGNGSIDDGSELFGDQNGAANGFLELAKYDADSNGVIDAGDPVFDALKIFRRTMDGFETKPLSQYSVEQIALQYDWQQVELQNGGIITQTGSFTAAGERRTAYDLLLPFKSGARTRAAA